MIFEETPLAGAFVIEPEPVSDNRGLLRAPLLRQEPSPSAGLNPHLDQISMSLQRPRRDRCAGCICSVRRMPRPSWCASRRGRSSTSSSTCGAGSPTFGRWFGAELSAANRRQLYIPEGLRARLPDARSTTARSPITSRRRTRPRHAAGIRWDDPDLAIAWPDPAAATISRPRRRSCRCLPTSSP